MTAPTVILSVNTAWNAWNFRSGLIRAMMDEGYRVVVAAPTDRYAEHLTRAGCQFVHLAMDSNGVHPGRDLGLLMQYVRLMRLEAPVAYLGYTIKPNVYGSIAAQIMRIPVINNIAGLGAAFIDQGIVTRIARLLYRASLRRSTKVFFQNIDDQELFTAAGLARADVTDLLPGSGIDPSLYRPVIRPTVEADCFRFLLVGRMLINKGVCEFAEAAKILQNVMPSARFQLLGPVNQANPNSVPVETLRGWQDAGLLEYLGATEDVRPYLENVDCVVLPSYREGVPRTLLEAAAMGLPIIATNVPGCRQVVDDHVNGLLCRVRDVRDLADKMLTIMRMHRGERQRMGLAGRLKIEREFDEAIVIRKYLDAVGAIARPNRQEAHVCAAGDFES